MGVRKDDIVTIIAGKDKGKSGRVIELNRERGRVRVEKLNIVKRHQKPTQQQRQGGIIEKEAWLSLSNVMFLEAKTGKPTRLGMKVEKGGNKIRISRRTREGVDAPK